MEYHLVLNGVTILDTGTVIEVEWHMYVSGGAQTDSAYELVGKFARGDRKYRVWVSRKLDRKPTIDGMKKLVSDYHAYVLNPFGLAVNE